MREWVYAVDSVSDDLVVLPVDVAAELAALHDAIQSSATFGEFIGQLSASAAAGHVDELMVELEDVGIDLGTEFELERLPGAGDDLFPPRVHTAMLDALGDLLEVADVGTVADEMGGVPMLVLTSADLPAIREFLIGQGHELREQPELLLIA